MDNRVWRIGREKREEASRVQSECSKFSKFGCSRYRIRNRSQAIFHKTIHTWTILARDYFLAITSWQKLIILLQSFMIPALNFASIQSWRIFGFQEWSYLLLYQLLLSGSPSVIGKYPYPSILMRHVHPNLTENLRSCWRYFDLS